MDKNAVLAKAKALAEALSKMTPLERTLAANDPTNGSVGVRMIALTMVS